jgi:predicted SnoaL-like aldol condensation-catalyzing enzyme
MWSHRLTTTLAVPRWASTSSASTATRLLSTGTTCRINARLQIRAVALSSMAPTKVTESDKTDANKLLMKGYFNDVVLGGQREKAAQYRSADNFHQHNCDGEDNKSGFQTKTGIFAKPGFVFKYTKAHKILGQGNFVLVMSEGLFDAKATAFYDLYRMENGKQVEHWDVLETIPPSNQWKNPNGKF